MKVLVLNSGSSSIKYQLLDPDVSRVYAAGLVERIGEGTSSFVHRRRGPGDRFEENRSSQAVRDHREGLALVMESMVGRTRAPGPDDLAGIGHRVVHGGETFRQPALITPAVIESIRALNRLAPLHNPANVQGIELALELCAGVPQVAVFDTAFHLTLAPQAYRYAIPRRIYSEQGVRRFGFHGISHGYVARQAAALLGRPLASLNLVSLHLGNGSSATAIEGGRSVDTSMGMTPLEGLVMGTRCGDLDPAVPLELCKAGFSIPEIERLLNQESGLKGLCGTNDMREILNRVEVRDSDAELALAIYCRRVRKYIGAYAAVLPAVHAVIFTGGIGENSAVVRRHCCEGMEALGLVLDESKNRAASDEDREIQSASSRAKILVIRTNEELEVARQTLACIHGDGAGAGQE